ncbi:MAG: hypothetical protein AB8B94_11535 [Hyphomicrobiales bacterium]
MHIALLRQSLLIVTMIAALIVPSSADSLDLPNRGGPIPVTTNGVPHVQIGVEAVPEISTKLLRQVSNIPGVEFGETVLSLPGAKGFWVRKNIQLANPDAIIRGREFAHLHPDGSLHASLSPKLAK